MPTLCTSVCVSSSHSSMCDEATRISCGPVRVPGTYDVVRSSGIGRTTTRAPSKSVVVGVVPPYSPIVTCSYSNGRFIHFPESEKAVGCDAGAVDGHWPGGEIEHRPLAAGQQLFCALRERGREERQGDRRVGLNRHARGIRRQLAPALRFLETRTRGAAEMGHVRDDLQ